jgi:branched-chain amino acid transport system substrate-binding protein
MGRPWRTDGRWGVLGLLGACACSLIDGKFNECSTNSDCAAGKICVADPQNTQQNVCVPLLTPPGCSGVPDAGILPTYGDVDAGELHLGATLAFTSATGINTNKVENLNAMAMALDEINQSIGAGHKTFVLHVCDNGGDSAQIHPQVEWMINTLGVPAILIPGSTNVITAAADTIPAGVLVMSPTATSPSITSLAKNPDGGPALLWRTAPSDVLQGRVIADLLMGVGPFDGGSALPQAAKVAIIYSDESYGQGLQQAIQNEFDAGTRTLDTFNYPLGGDVTTAVGQLVTFHPQVTVCIGFPSDVPRIVNTAAGMGLTAAGGHRWLFTDAAKDPSIITAVTDPSQIASALGTAPAQGAGAAYSTFSMRFINRFGVDPSNYGFTSHSYDATYLLALAGSYAVGSANTAPMTGIAMEVGLTRVSDLTASTYDLGPSGYIGARSDLQNGRTINVDGASGALDFDPTTGESLAPIEIWGIDGGVFQTLATVTPPSN